MNLVWDGFNLFAGGEVKVGRLHFDEQENTASGSGFEEVFHSDAVMSLVGVAVVDHDFGVEVVGCFVECATHVGVVLRAEEVESEVGEPVGSA